MDYATFFKQVRANVFGGSLTKGQVDGMEKIIDYWQTTWPKMSLDEFAYLLGTVYWETAHRMAPVKEMGSQQYLRSKKYYPYIGVGLIQATWKANWDKLGIKSIADGLQWPSALHAAFYGMAAGIYTGKKLADYIGNGKRDYVNARRIINGTDRAQEIAKIAENFRSALIAANAKPTPTPAPPQPTVVVDDNFVQSLLKALENDDVRAKIIEICFPDDGQQDEIAFADPNDEEHPDYGGEQVALNDEPDSTYG
jgi:hypothetical protein